MVTLPTFRRQSDEEALRFPLAGHGRLALVDTAFRVPPGMHACVSTDLRGLTKFGPESMVLPVRSAVSLADQVLRGSLELPSLKFAIVVITALEGAGAGLLTDPHRDLLWRAFGLPVFEQLTGRDARVIARECEVHDGMHVEDASVARSHGELITWEHCDCGLATPRLRDLGRLRVCTAAAA